jgi:hypothetical protein
LIRFREPKRLFPFGGGLILLMNEDGKPKSSPGNIFLWPGEKTL